MNKLKAREDALKKQNNNAPAGMMINMDNIINPYQLTDFDQRLYNAIAKNGFAIVPAEEEQLFHIYENNDYRQFPSFVTTDLYLQVFHMFFDCLLKETEEQKFSPLVTDFVKLRLDEKVGGHSHRCHSKGCCCPRCCLLCHCLRAEHRQVAACIG